MASQGSILDLGENGSLSSLVNKYSSESCREHEKIGKIEFYGFVEFEMNNSKTVVLSIEQLTVMQSS